MSDESPSKDSDNDDIVTGAQLFYQKIEREVREKDPRASFADIAAKVDQEWKNLSKEEQRIYKNRASQRNKALIEKETSHLPAPPDVVTIEESEDEDEGEEDDLVWDDEPESNANSSSTKPTIKKSAVPKLKRCIRLGCPNSARSNPEWDEEFCSEKCVVNHCKQIFNRWKENRMSSSIDT